MQKKIQQFVFLSERLLGEVGELRARKTWNELSSVSVQLAQYMQQLSQSFDPKYGLLFLLSCGNDGTQKNGCFSMLFRKILSKVPNEDLLKLLSSVNRVELNSYLLPFLYEKGNIGSIAAYSAAKLGLKVKYDSFEFFLPSREWSPQDLVNLSFLVLNEEKDSLIMSLDSIYNTNPKDVYLQFLNVLNASNIVEPVIPELQVEDDFIQQKPIQNPQKSSTQNLQNNAQTNNSHFKLSSNKQNTTVNEAQSFSNTSEPSTENKEPIRYVPEKEDTDNDSNNKTNNVVSPTSRSSFNKSIKLPPTNTNSGFTEFVNNIKEKLSSLNSNNDSPLKKPSVLITIVVVLIIILYLLTRTSGTGASVESSNDNIPEPPKEVKMPDYWINAVTNQKVTPRFLEADVDYRMGELYLSRELYSEAISFFESALKIDPTHNIAKLRWGYAELLQGNNFASVKILKEVLKADPKLQNVNLYLARNYVQEKKYSDAEKYYKLEYKYYDKLDVGMEYANFLANIGKQDEAMDFLSTLQSRYPDKMLILDAQPEEQKKDKTK